MASGFPLVERGREEQRGEPLAQGHTAPSKQVALCGFELSSASRGQAPTLCVCLLDPRVLTFQEAHLIIIIFKDFIYFGERGREGEREGEKQPLVPSCTPPTGDLARNPGMCPDLDQTVTLWFPGLP